MDTAYSARRGRSARTILPGGTAAAGARSQHLAALRLALEQFVTAWWGRAQLPPAQSAAVRRALFTLHSPCSPIVVADELLDVIFVTGKDDAAPRTFLDAAEVVAERLAAARGAAPPPRAPRPVRVRRLHLALLD